jgi:hypothetical protein
MAFCGVTSGVPARKSDGYLERHLKYFDTSTTLYQVTHLRVFSPIESFCFPIIMPSTLIPNNQDANSLKWYECFSGNTQQSVV